MFSRLKAESDTVPFNTWGQSDMEDVFSFFDSSEVQMIYLFIYVLIYLFICI